MTTLISPGVVPPDSPPLVHGPSGKPIWARRQFCAPSGNRELFPIPHLPCPPLQCGASRVARRKLRHRLDVWRESNETFDALNSLYGCSEYLGAEKGGGLSSEAQKAIQHRVSTLVARRRPYSVPQPKVAARQLLGSHLGYSGGGSSVEPYDASRVSLPELQGSPVPWDRAIPGHLRECLQLDNMPADDDVVRYRQEHESVTLYTDVRIARDKQLRWSFYARLARCGWSV